MDELRKRKQRVQIEVVLLFEHPIELSKPIHFEKAIPNTTPDIIILNGKVISLILIIGDR